MKTLIKYLLVTLFFSGCLIYQQSAELSTSREAYSGNELRVDGYYFLKSKNFQGDIYSINFLYQNGVFLNIGAVDEITKVEEYINSISEPKNLESFQKDRAGWGVFKIDGTHIKFERWYPSGPPIQTWIRSGKILNDTTFQVTSTYKPDGSDRDERNELYHFKEFSPKPDSTNTFIK